MYKSNPIQPETVFRPVFPPKAGSGSLESWETMENQTIDQVKEDQNLSQGADENQNDDPINRNMSISPETELFSGKRMSSPTGVLSLCLKNIKVLAMDIEKLFSRKDISLYVKVSLLDQVKFTICYEHMFVPCCIKFDEMKHFRVSLSENMSEPGDFLFELVAVQTIMHRTICSKRVNMFAVINSGVGTKTLHLEGMGNTKHVEVELNVEFCFTYGFLGYGVSNQYDMAKCCETQVKHSMFFRSEPPLNRCDLINDVIQCGHIGHPRFANFPFKANLQGAVCNSVPDLATDDFVEPTILTTKLEQNFKLKQDKYHSITSRIKRLNFLKSVVSNSDATTAQRNEYFVASYDVSLKRRSLQHELSSKQSSKTHVKAKWKSLVTKLESPDKTNDHIVNRTRRWSFLENRLYPKEDSQGKAKEQMETGKRRWSLFSGRVYPLNDGQENVESNEDSKHKMLPAVDENQETEESQDITEKENVDIPTSTKYSNFQVPEMKVEKCGSTEDQRDCFSTPKVPESRRVSVTWQTIPRLSKRGSMVGEAAMKVKMLFGTAMENIPSNQKVVVIDADYESDPDNCDY